MTKEEFLLKLKEEKEREIDTRVDTIIHDMLNDLATSTTYYELSHQYRHLQREEVRDRLVSLGFTVSSVEPNNDNSRGWLVSAK